MTAELTTDAGANVRIYRFRDFLGAGTAAVIVTEYSHLLSDEEREGWTAYGDGDNPPREYPPAMMSDEDHFDHRGNPA